MKKLIYIAALFITNVCLAQNMGLDFIKTYEGSTEDGQAFYMKLKSFSGNLQGSIFFKNTCKILKIKGNLKAVRAIEFNAYNEANNLIYSFNGRAENNSKITGDFSEFKNKSTFFALESTENFDTVLLNCAKVRQTTALNTFVIDRLILQKFPATKSNGKSWDGYMTGFKADVYFLVTDKSNKKLYDMDPKYYTDISAENLPLLLNTEKVKFSATTLNGEICISFFDHDSVSNHDNLGGVCFSVTKNPKDSSMQTKTIDFGGVKFTLEYHYEK